MILTAPGAGSGVVTRETAAPATDVQFPPRNVLRRRLARTQREEVVHIHVAQEESVVEGAQVLADALLPGMLHAPPCGGMALAALDEGEMNGVFVRLQIVGVADSVSRADAGAPVASGLRIGHLRASRSVGFASSPFERSIRTRFRPLRVGIVPIA